MHECVIVSDEEACCCHDGDMSSSSEELRSAACTPRSNASPAPSSRMCSPASTDSNGWYVTPPSCFTAGSPPHAIEASPLEDLLIEHPSMSVYHNKISTRRGSLSSQDSSSSSSSPSPRDQPVLENQVSASSRLFTCEEDLPTNKCVAASNGAECRGRIKY